MTNPFVEGTARWYNYVLDRGDTLRHFWSSHLNESVRDVLFVLGKGFDPRLCNGLEAILDAGGSGRRDVLAVAFEEGRASPSEVHQPEALANWEQLERMLKGKGSLHSKPIKMRSDDGRSVGSRAAAGVLKDWSDIKDYSDVLIDISAMPRSVYFPLIAKALHIIDDATSQNTRRPINLHVLVSNNPSLDECIKDEGVEDTAIYVYPFAGGLEREATAMVPRIWIPLLGEGQSVQLERIHTLVVPDEICPVLPSPSLDPRRGDKLVLEYRELLLDSLRVEPRNFIYASESNPFEVYRQIGRTIVQYRGALTPLGGCKTVLSALSSKLMSVGALLVAYELREDAGGVGIAHVESRGYQMDPGVAESVSAQSELCSLWVAGECYESN